MAEALEPKLGNILMTADQSWHAVGIMLITDPSDKDILRPKLRYGPSGEEYIKFTLRVSRGAYKWDYFPCYAWRYAARFISEHGLHKALVSVIGQWEHTKAHLDDKSCPHCHKTLNPRIRDWFRLHVFKISILSGGKWDAAFAETDAATQSVADPFASST